MLLGQRIAEDAGYIQEILPTWSDEQRNQLQLQLKQGRAEHETDTCDFMAAASSGGRVFELVSEIETKLKQTVVQLKNQETHQLLIELCNSETTFRPQRQVTEQKEGPLDLTLFQQVAQGVVEVIKDGEKYQMREVMQWETSQCGDDPKSFIEKQLRGNDNFQGFKKAKPFQFIGGKQLQFERGEYFVANQSMGGADFPLKCLEALKKSIELTLAREWEEELGSALNKACLERICNFCSQSNTWTLRRKTRGWQAADGNVLINYDLGRTTCTIDWEMEVKDECKAVGVLLSSTVREQFQLKKKAQGADSPFSWDRVDEECSKGGRDRFDFVISQDEGGAGSDSTSKIIVFMLVKPEWLPDDDPADEIVGEWVGGRWSGGDGVGGADADSGV
jgi:hypothetical protein